MGLMTVAVNEHDITGTHDGLDRYLVRGGGAIRSEKQMLTTKGPGRFFLSNFDIACRFEQRIQAAGRSRRFGQENVRSVEMTKVANPMRVENRLASRHRQGVEGANRPARVVLQVIKVRRVVTLVDSLQESEMDLHQVFDPVEDSPNVLGIEMACYLLHRAVHDEIYVQLRTDLPDDSCERHSVILWLERAAVLRHMLLEVSAQERGIELGLETKVILDNDRLQISIDYRSEDSFVKTRHCDRFIHKRVFRPAQLSQFVAALAHLFRCRIVANDQDLEVGLRQIARVEVVLQETIGPFFLSFLAGLPCIRRTTIGTSDNRLRDAVGDS